LKHVEFCALSGDLPNRFCTQHVEGWFIPGVSPIKTCDVHREVLVDVATGLRVPIDDGIRQLKREVYEFWPATFTLFECWIPRRVPLLPAGHCVGESGGQKPILVFERQRNFPVRKTIGYALKPTLTCVKFFVRRQAIC
jgi:penicillin-binding protein 1C